MSVTYLRPDFAEGFLCDGRACGSRCCRDWSVWIDPATCGKYHGAEPEEFRREVCRWLEEQEEGGGAWVRLREDGRCPYLGEDFLCRIQREKGEDYLSDLCFSYPRVTCSIGKLRRQTLVLSCPLAARRLLGLQRPLGFLETQEEEGRWGRRFDVTELAAPYGEWWQPLARAGIFFLQQGQGSLDRRLLLLLLFYEGADELWRAGGPDALGSLWAAGAEEGEALPFAPAVPEGWAFRRRLHVEKMMELYHGLYGSPSQEQRREELLAVYCRGEEAFRREVLGRRGLSLENYLVNEFFMRFYPFAYGDSLGRNARIFILAWKMVEFGLRMLAAQQPLDDERFLLGMDRLTERIDHHRNGMKTVREMAAGMAGGLQFASCLLDAAPDR